MKMYFDNLNINVYIIDKPGSKYQVQVQSPCLKSNRKGKEELGLLAVSKILRPTTDHHPTHNF